MAQRSYTVRTGYVVHFDDGSDPLPAGTVFRATPAQIKGREHQVEALDVHVAEPEEKKPRRRRRRRKSAAAS